MLDPMTIAPGLVALLFKVGFLILAIFYFLYSLIIIRQINMMSEAVVTDGSSILRLISYINVVISVLVIVIFIFFL